MAHPGEQAQSQVVGIKPNRATLKGSNGAFRHLMQEHGDVFALVKRLGMSPGDHVRQPIESRVRVRVEVSLQELGRMAQVYAALREMVQTMEPSADNDAEPSDLADAMAALDATNPGSPEWGPAFLQLSELLEARVNEEESDFPPKSDEQQQLPAAC
ncbi:MAG: hypothetical protein WDO69_02985 [Pseudomonadota bacterium]